MLTDALLSVPISALLLTGIIGIKKIILRINSNNDLLLTLSQLDPLTNSLSRTEIFYRITQEIERGKRNGRPFALLEMDIDHFKLINDQYGHHVGDEILISLVRHSKDILRPMDALGRIGGEEFLILLPETDTKQAIEVAERLRLHIANSSHINSANFDIKITISIGVAVFDPNQHSTIQADAALAEIVNKSDVAMYKAKNAGRNRVSQ